MAAAPQGYIGRSPSDGRTTINRQTFNVTTGVQTSFTFTSGYDLGYLEVYLNGIKQNETTDYTAADGSTFSFAVSTPAVQGDTLEAIAYKSFNTTNVTGSTRDFAVGRNLDVTGNVTIGSSLTVASDLIVNGTYTYVNTEILDIEDKTVGIASTSAASNTTADGAGIVVYGGSDGDKSLTWNKQKSNWVLVGGGVSIGTGCTIGSSTANVLEFSVDGAVNAKLNNYGAFIVGDGVDGEAWGDSYKTVQAGTGAFGGNPPAASASSYWTTNAYYDAVNSRWEYIAGDEASRLAQGDGALAYYNASSGSADGAITWSERFRVDSSGRFLLGTSSARTDVALIGDPYFQQEGLSSDTGGMSIIRNTNSAAGAYLVLGKTRGTSDGSNTIVQDDDTIGSILFAPADGNDVNQVCASLTAIIDGTPGSNDVPGALTFQTTADSGSQPTEALRIGQNGFTTLNSGNGRTNACLVLTKADAGYAKLEFDVGTSQKAYVELDASEDLVLYGAANVSQIFYTGGAERLRITSDGKLLVGSTTVYAHANGDELQVGTTTGDHGIAIISGDDSNGEIHFGDGGSTGNANVKGQIVYTHSVDAMRFFTDVTERVRIDSSGRLLVGHTASYGSSKLQSFSNTAYVLDLSTWSADANGPTVDFYKSRNATIGSATVVQSGDVVGKLRFLGNDGANSRTAAQITAEVDGTPGTNDMPGRLIFATTADGGSSSTERLRIDSSGEVLIGKTTTSWTEAGVRISQSGSIAIIESSTSTNQATANGGTLSLINYSATDNNFSHIGGYNSNSLVTSQINFVNTSHSSRTGDITFRTHDGSSMPERLRIDSGGRVLIGTTTSLSNYGVQNRLQVAGTDYATSGIGIRRDSNDSGGGAIIFGKSRGSQGGNTVVQSGDSLGEFVFCGGDGTDVTSYAATINVSVDGTPGSNDMPGRITFSTTSDGSAGVTERVRIDSAGRLMIGTTSITGISAGSDDIIIGSIGDSTTRGLTFATTGEAAIRWADAGDNAMGRIQYSNSTDLMTLHTSNTIAMSLDSSQRVLIGHTASMFGDQKLQISSTTSTGSILLGRWSNNNYSSYLNFFKSRHTSIVDGSGTMVQSGDLLGTIAFYGDDATSGGDNRALAAEIQCLVAGSPGSSDMPGKLRFKCSNDGSDSPTTRFELSESGADFTCPGDFNCSSSSTVTACRFYNSTNNSGANCSIQIKTFANSGADPYIHFDSGGSNMVVGQRWMGTTNNYLALGAGDSPAGGVTGLFIYPSGNATLAGSLTENSDISLKENVVTITDALSKVNQLRGVEYDKIETNRHEIGCIAQEVQSVIPEVVEQTAESSILSLSYGRLTAVLIEAVKELTTEVETLKTKVASLESS